MTVKNASSCSLIDEHVYACHVTSSRSQDLPAFVSHPVFWSGIALNGRFWFLLPSSHLDVFLLRLVWYIWFRALLPLAGDRACMAFPGSVVGRRCEYPSLGLGVIVGSDSNRDWALPGLG
jgi:hypothetical protein